MNAGPLEAGRGRSEEFPSLEGMCYLNTASIGIMPTRALSAADEFQRQLGLYGTTWFDEPTEVGALDKAREEAAELLGAPAQSIAVTTSVTEAMSQIAWSLRPGRGSNIVSIDLEFPSVTYPWMRVAKETGAEVRLVSAKSDPAELSLNSVAEQVDAQTSVISVSHVQYSTGVLFDLDELADLADEVGAQLIVDASQSLGAVPIDLSSPRVDALLCAGYKWLCGPFGAALCYAGPALIDRLDPPFIGWKSAIAPYSLEGSRLDLADSPVMQLEYSTMAYPAGAALAAAIAEVRSVGVDSIFQHNLALGQTLFEGLDRIGAQVLTPRQETRRSGIVTAQFPGLDGEEVASWLNRSGVIVSPRFGSTRFSVHFFNTGDDVEFALDTLERVLAAHGPVDTDRIP